MAFKVSPLIYSLFTVLFFSFSSFASNSLKMWPGSQYNDNIPTFEQVLAYDVGERITNHSDMLRYFEALAQAAPKRIKLFEYGRTWEGRKLIYAAIGNSENLADLEHFADSNAKVIRST